MRYRFPAAFRPPAFASRVILFPRGELGLHHGRLTTHQQRAGPFGVSTFHSRDTTGLGASLPRGTGGASLTECRARPASAASQRLRPCTPPHASHRAGLRFTRHQRGFTRFTRPVCPSPVAPAMGRGLLRLSPRASHPAVTSSARQGRGQAASTRLGLHHRHHAGPPNCGSTRKVRHRVATADPDSGQAPPGALRNQSRSSKKAATG